MTDPTMEIMAELNRRTSVYEADLLRIVEHTNSDEAKAIACAAMYIATLVTAILASARA